MTHRTSPSRALRVPSNRLARAKRMGSMTAGVAGSMALNGLRQLGRGQSPKARELLLTPANMRRIADQLAAMRGAAMKIGQLVSMDSGDVLPPELAQILARLRADADFMPPRQLRDVLDAAWGAGWRTRFAAFNVRPIAAASIGQVHRARLPGGADLAIKVQYPGIAQSIDSDVANVGRLIKLSGLLPNGFEREPYLDEARRQLHDEADYTREAQCMARFAQLLAGWEDFAVPEQVQDLSSQTVLTMTYLPGQAIETLTDLDQATRDQIATRLFDLTLHELFHYGWMQTDPNFANYRYCRDTGRIILLDFGATREVSPKAADQYRAIIVAGLAQDDLALANAVEEMGLVHPDTPAPFRAQILNMTKRVFELLCTNPLFDFANSPLAAEMQSAGTEMARAGFVPPPMPMELLFIQRKLAGMVLLATRLKARVPLRSMIERAIATG